MNLPALHGNWVDLIIILVLLFYLGGGIGRGFVLSTINLGGFLLSFASGLKFYSLVGDILIANFSLPRGIANAAGFLICGLATELIISFLINLFYRRLYSAIFDKLTAKKLQSFVQRLDQILGFIPALGEAVLFTAFILTLLITLPVQGAIKKDILASKIGGPLVARTQGIERQLNKIFGGAVNETLTFLTVNPNPSSEEKVDLGFTAEEVKIDESAEATMFLLINQEREKAGVGKLAIDLKLREVSRSHARDMLARGFFSHYNPEGLSPFDRLENANIQFLAAGENLALAPNVFLAHTGLMNSPGHKANILSPDFGKVGIGVIDGGIYGEMFVQEFTN